MVCILEWRALTRSSLSLLARRVWVDEGAGGCVTLGFGFGSDEMARVAERDLFTKFNVQNRYCKMNPPHLGVHMAENKLDSAQRNDLLNRLALGTQKTVDNAISLFNEASLLHKSGFLCRALFLHQISLEECAKIEMLGAAATSLLMGHEVDFAKVKKALISHARKNRENAYFLEMSAEERAAMDSGDFEEASKIFSAMKDKFHLKSNTAKNASLYVDVDDKLNFIAPKDSITEEMVAEIAALNEKYLDSAIPKVEMLKKWVARPDDAAKLMVNFENLFEQQKAENPDNPRKAMAQVMEQMLQIMLKAQGQQEP